MYLKIFQKEKAYVIFIEIRLYIILLNDKMSRNKNYLNKYIAVNIMLSLALVSTCNAESNSAAINKSTKVYSVNLGATRIIYRPESNGEAIQVINPNNFPVLVQGSITKDDDKNNDNTPFIVTPPLFRLNASQQSQVKVVMTEEPILKDRESLYWFCETGIPPENGDVWDESNKKNKKTASVDVNIKISQCIKLMVRPNEITDSPSDVADKITWSREGDKLTASNPTPFYMNIGSLFVGKTEITSPNYIPPMGKQEYKIPKNAEGIVSWKIINDLGGMSSLFKDDVK